MYRIVKRIVRTVTTVTWLVHLEGKAAEGKLIENEITFPSSVSITEEEVLNTKNNANVNHLSHKPTLFDVGENHES